ncbi:hypothetical protein JMJ35_009815 [Cladonia borealis]|uniref:Uncharacterized protein n=1 Tax=Cladonia borealis TaxID=184061 RepID=A0AA39U510_9LECA|nr:hypothetical protein JMJ35_009815 [Cladonia borealis]
MSDDAQDVDSRTPLLKQSVPRPASLSRKISSLLQDWWLWEILSALTALISSTVIIVILVIFDSSSLPDWPSVFTINSTISFFAVITKLAITSALGASISQSKWLWYRQEEPRPLKDLQLFEDASRGPWGALALLFSIRARHIAFVGATITVLMLLFDPFLQQVVVYPDRLVASEKTATIVRAQNYVARSEEGLPLPSVVDMSLKAAIYEGIFDVRDQADVNIEHYCSTGNCTWQDFSSLAVCSKCANITSYIEKSCNETGCHHLYLPDGPTITGSGSQINSSTTNISPDLANTTASIIQFTSLISKSNASPSAYECALFYCINTYTASVTDGAISQTITSTFLNNTATHSQSSDLLYTPPPSFTNNNTTTSNTTTTTFTVSSLAALALNSFMTTTFTGHGHISPPSSNTTSFFSSDTIHALYSTTNYTARINNLAISMTNNIRQQNSSGSSPHPGIAFKTETYVKLDTRFNPRNLVEIIILIELGQKKNLGFL